MVTEHVGDLLESGCDIICRQECKERYKEHLGYLREYFDNILGSVIYSKTDNVYANCFFKNEDETINYDAVEKCFKQIEEFAWEHHCKTIGVLKNYGCGIAVEKWGKVKTILTNIFKDSDVELQIWEKK